MAVPASSRKRSRKSSCELVPPETTDQMAHPTSGPTATVGLLFGPRVTVAEACAVVLPSVSTNSAPSVKTWREKPSVVCSVPPAP
jgi:hypothetical protein